MVDEENDSNRGSHNAKKIPYTREFLLAVNEKKPVCKELPSDWDRIKRENSELTFFRNVRETGDLEMKNGVMDGLRPEMSCKTFDPVSGKWISEVSGTRNRKPKLDSEIDSNIDSKLDSKPVKKILNLMEQKIPENVKIAIKMLHRSEKVMTENKVMDPSRPQMSCKTFDPVSGQWI